MRELAGEFKPIASHDSAATAAGRTAAFDAEPVITWLVGEARRITVPGALLAALGRRLVADGLPLARASLHLQVLHPQYRAESFVWRRGDEAVTEAAHGEGSEREKRYLDSPLRAILEEGAEGVRRRLDVPSGAPDYPIFDELRADGLTDYVMMPLVFSDGLRNAVSWASDRPGGFRVDELDALYRMLPHLSLVLEALIRHLIARTVLETYVGREAGRRVLAGEIRRGSGQTLRAAIWYSDMRDFTRLSETRPSEAVIALLNHYFDCVAGAVHARGGEVLKFMGDGMLAIFPCNDASRCDATAAALAAARDALDRLAAADCAELETGIALHYGDVLYGNIGAADRLDFTVIGPAVNLVARIERLSRELLAPIVMTEAFAGAAAIASVSLGVFDLKGIAERQRVFTLPGLAAPRPA